MLTLDADGLTSALHAAGTLDPEARVDAVDQRPVGTGQMGDCLRLALTYDREVEAPATIVAKLPSSNETSRATGMAMRTYEVEVRFYQQLAAGLPVRSPQCHHAEIDIDTGDFVLLLEDLAPAEQGDQVAGCSVDQARLVLAEAARLHAPRWGDPTLDQLDWAVRWSQESQDLMQAMITMLWPNFVERYGDDLDDDVVAMGDRFIAGLAAYYGHRPGPHTVTHNDFRLDNLLFGTEAGGPPVAVVDWQTVGVGPALGDVSYFLGAGLSVEDRRAHEEALVREYHQALLTAGVEGFDWDRCWSDYRAFAFSGFHMAVLASMIVERTDRGDAMFLAMAGRHGRQVLDLGSEEFLGVSRVGRLERIWVKRSMRGLMDAVDTAELQTGTGIIGNADQGGRRQVTILSAERWQRAEADLGLALDPSTRRANLLVSGIDLVGSRGRVLTIGGTRLEVWGETRPCRVMDFAHAGLQAALDADWGGGVYAKVLDSGTITIGAEVVLEV